MTMSLVSTDGYDLGGYATGWDTITNLKVEGTIIGFFYDNDKLEKLLLDTGNGDVIVYSK